MKRLLGVLLLVILSLSFGEDLEGLKDFFQRKGFIVERLDNRVIIDLGEGKVKVGEVFSVTREGKELIHPVTGEVLGKVEEEVGKVKVWEVKESFSYAEILEDKGIRKGDRIRLFYEDVCFVGSEEGFFKVSSLVKSLRKGEGCNYVVREFEGGFGVEFKGKAVAFFHKRTVVAEKEERIEEFRAEAKFVVTFSKLPLSADSCDLFGKGKDYLAVLFEDSLKIYEVLEKEVIEYASLKLPSGFPVSTQCAPFDGERDVILVNIVSGGEMSSAVVKAVGGTLVVVKEGIPYYMTVLDKERASDTFIGQRFDGRNFWGEVRKLKLEGNEVIEGEPFDVPSGFRADSAVMLGDTLVFTDRDGYLRVFRGEELLYSEKDFSGSYTTAELPGTYEDDSKYTFNTRHFLFSIGKRKFIGVVKNVTSPVYRFLDVTKFSEGELYALTEGKRGLVELKKIRGRKFEEAVQAVVGTEDGQLYVLTGRTGTLPFQNRGDLFKVEITPF